MGLRLAMLPAAVLVSAIFLGATAYGWRAAQNGLLPILSRPIAEIR